MSFSCKICLLVFLFCYFNDYLIEIGLFYLISNVLDDLQNFFFLLVVYIFYCNRFKYVKNVLLKKIIFEEEKIKNFMYLFLGQL